MIGRTPVAVGQPAHRQRAEHEERARRGGEEDDRAVADAERVADVGREHRQRRRLELVERAQEHEHDERADAADAHAPGASETSSSPTPGRRSSAKRTSSCVAGLLRLALGLGVEDRDRERAASPGVVVDAAPSSMSADLLVDHQLLRRGVVLVRVQGLLPRVRLRVVLDGSQPRDRHGAQLLRRLAEAGDGQVLARRAGELGEEGDVLARGARRRLVVGRARLRRARRSSVAGGLRRPCCSTSAGSGR